MLMRYSLPHRRDAGASSAIYVDRNRGLLGDRGWLGRRTRFAADFVPRDRPFEVEARRVPFRVNHKPLKMNETEVPDASNL